MSSQRIKFSKQYWDNYLSHKSDVSAHHIKTVNPTDYYTKTEMHQFLSISSGNAHWHPCSLHYWRPIDPAVHTNAGLTFRNSSVTDFSLGFIIPMGSILTASYDLYLANVRIQVYDADDSDYVDRMRIFGMTSTIVTLVDDGVNIDSGGPYTYSFTDKNISGYNTVVVWLDIFITTIGEFDLSAVEAKLYYA